MPLHVSVKGGTGAGRKRARPPLKAWICAACGADVAKYWAKCPVCAEPRPEQ